jgi:hypothetical protein
VEELMELGGDWKDPIVVRPSPSPVRAKRWPYALVDGYHRYEAATRLGLDWGDALLGPASGDWWLFFAVRLNRHGERIETSEVREYYFRVIRPWREANPHDPRNFINEIARQLGVSTTTLYGWEHGEHLRAKAPTRGNRTLKEVSNEELATAFHRECRAGVDPYQAVENVATQFGANAYNIQRRIQQGMWRGMLTGDPRVGDYIRVFEPQHEAPITLAEAQEKLRHHEDQAAYWRAEVVRLTPISQGAT